MAKVKAQAQEAADAATVDDGDDAVGMEVDDAAAAAEGAERDEGGGVVKLDRGTAIRVTPLYGVQGTCPRAAAAIGPPLPLDDHRPPIPVASFAHPRRCYTRARHRVPSHHSRGKETLKRKVEEKNNKQKKFFSIFLNPRQRQRRALLLVVRDLTSRSLSRLSSLRLPRHAPRPTRQARIRCVTCWRWTGARSCWTAGGTIA